MFWLELNMEPENYQNVNELASDIVTLIKKDGIPVRVYRTYDSVMKLSTDPFMCKEFHFDQIDLISSMVRAGLRVIIFDTGVFKILVQKEDT